MPALIADAYNDNIHLQNINGDYLIIEGASAISNNIYSLLKTNPEPAIDALINVISSQLDCFLTVKKTSGYKIVLINYDGNDLHKKISTIFSNVHCQFADKNKHWFHCVDLSIGQVIYKDEIIEMLSYFLDYYDVCDFDGFYLIINNAGVTTDKDLASRVNILFNIIFKELNPCVIDDIHNNNWRLNIKGEELYFLAFSNHYPTNHSRHLPLNDSIAFLIQPDSAFDKFTYKKTNLIKKNVRNSIRNKYKKNGILYNYTLSESTDHKCKFVKSTGTELIISWWDI
jgi:hypothetical protein